MRNQGTVAQSSNTATTTTTTTTKGLVCLKYGCAHLPIVYTRPRAGHILRVRSCRHCGRRMLTRERIN